MWTRMKEIYPKWMTDPTVLTKIAELLRNNDEETGETRFAWFYDNIDVLNIEYFTNSLQKIASPLVLELSESENRDEMLAKVIINRYANRWLKLCDLYKIEYNPIENYSAEEKTVHGLTITTTPIHEEVNTIKTNVHTVTSTERNSEDNRFGFNSKTAVPTNTGKVGDTVTTDAGEDKNNSEQKLIRNGDQVDRHTGTDVLTRKGNVGVTTSQQMLESEIDLWSKWDFISELYRDIDSVLCLKIY